jgi:hypothetical protein
MLILPTQHLDLFLHNHLMGLTSLVKVYALCQVHLHFRSKLPLSSLLELYLLLQISKSRREEWVLLHVLLFLKARRFHFSLSHIIHIPTWDHPHLYQGTVPMFPHTFLMALIIPMANLIPKDPTKDHINTALHMVPLMSCLTWVPMVLMLLLTF